MVSTVVATTAGPASGDADLCVAAGLTGRFLAQCQANAQGATTTQVDLCGGLTGDELAQCEEAASDPAAKSELCVASGLVGETLAQCQADTGNDSVIEVDLCSAAGTNGAGSPGCVVVGGDGTGGTGSGDLCVDAGLSGDALSQCQAAGGGGGGGGGRGGTVEIELCSAAGLTGDALTQCQAGDSGSSTAELCAAAGLTGAALAQCQADTGGDTIVSIDLCAAAGLTGDALAACAAAGPDLRQGGVFAMSNDPEGNEVVAYFRADDGTLFPAGTFPTDGLGSGGFEDSAHGLVLGSTVGETGPSHFTDETSLLFAVNAGSDDISVFQVNADGLELVDVEPSNGMKPVSITVHDGIAYEINSDETTDGTADLRNCEEGADPSITGFSIGDDGDLTPIADSTRPLSGGMESGCAQVSFNPAGTVVVVTQRTASQPEAGGGEGTNDTFVVNADGTLGAQQTLDASGQGPLGFTFTRDGVLLTAEQSGGPFGATRGAAAGYTVSDDGTLTPSGTSVGNEGTGTGWFVVTDDGTVGFTSSFFGEGRISSYAVGPDGSLQVLQADADPDVQAGASDLSLSGDGSLLFQLNSLEGTIGVFEVGPNGTLSRVGSVEAFDPSPTGAPFGLAAA